MLVLVGGKEYVFGISFSVVWILCEVGKTPWHSDTSVKSISQGPIRVAGRKPLIDTLLSCQTGERGMAATTCRLLRLPLTSLYRMTVNISRIINRWVYASWVFSKVPYQSVALSCLRLLLFSFFFLKICQIELFSFSSHLNQEWQNVPKKPNCHQPGL